MTIGKFSDPNRYNRRHPSASRVAPIVTIEPANTKVTIMRFLSAATVTIYFAIFQVLFVVHIVQTENPGLLEFIASMMLAVPVCVGLLIATFKFVDWKVGVVIDNGRLLRDRQS